MGRERRRRQHIVAEVSVEIVVLRVHREPVDAFDDRVIGPIGHDLDVVVGEAVRMTDELPTDDEVVFRSALNASAMPPRHREVALDPDPSPSGWIPRIKRSCRPSWPG